MKRITSFAALLGLVVIVGGCSMTGRGWGGCMFGSCADSPGNCAACACQSNCDPCASQPGILQKLKCGCGLGQKCGSCAPNQGQAFNPGPPSAAITYPYYTVRGPRDFLAENPQTIGP